MATWEEVGEEVRAIADAQEAERYARDPRVVAIRADKKIGRGTCSVIDECWTDRELVEHLDSYPQADGQTVRIHSPKMSVLAMRCEESIIADMQSEIESTAF